MAPGWFSVVAAWSSRAMTGTVLGRIGRELGEGGSEKPGPGRPSVLSYRCGTLSPKQCRLHDYICNIRKVTPASVETFIWRAWEQSAAYCHQSDEITMTRRSSVDQELCNFHRDTERADIRGLQELKSMALGGWLAVGREGNGDMWGNFWVFSMSDGMDSHDNGWEEVDATLMSCAWAVSGDRWMWSLAERKELGPYNTQLGQREHEGLYYWPKAGFMKVCGPGPLASDSYAVENRPSRLAGCP